MARDLIPLTRRGTLAALGAAALPAPLFARTGDVFRHGVASGDPDATSVVLWTRASLPEAGEVRWEVSDSPSFRRIRKAGIAMAGPGTDYTVKVLAQGLRPGGTWFYRFRAGSAVSPVGRARTLPAGRLDKLGIALASCSNYAFGHFNAYDAIAKDAAVDFVLHVGDYIYEYGVDGYGGDMGRRLGRNHEPPHEIVSLADYRGRHAQYKSDPGLQAMHGAHTLLACWDDHESANNPWTGGAQNHQPATEGDWNARRAASIRAYFEWMPLREPAPGRNRMQFWRSYRFGNFATLCTLETRHTARAFQVDYGPWVSRIKTAADIAPLRAAIAEPERRILAPEQEADLAAALRRSVREGQPWRLIGSPMVLARTDVPDLVSLGVLPDPPPPPTRTLAWKGKWNLPLQSDSWDGYPWARERVYELSRAAGAGDLVVLSGDSHAFWANRLADAAHRPAGIEFGTAGISSPGDFLSFGDELSGKVDAALGKHMEEVVWTDNRNNGYVRIELTRGGGCAHVMAVDTVLEPGYRSREHRRFTFARKDGVVDFT